MDRREGLQPEVAPINARPQPTGATGDDALIGHKMRLVNARLGQAVDLGAGQRGLDLATARGPRWHAGAGVGARAVMS